VFQAFERVEFSEAFPFFADMHSKRSKEAILREPTIWGGTCLSVPQAGV
jgi:hypothetical protein